MIVNILPLLETDWELMMAWRSNEAIYDKGCYTQTTALEWKEHYDWMCCRGDWWRFWVIWVDDMITRPRKVGIINVGQLDNWNPEFSYYLGETTLWGQGVAKEAILLLFDWFKKRGYCKVHTTTRNDNERAIGLMTSLGMKCVGVARVGESVWEIYLEPNGIDKATEYTSGRKPFG